MKLLVTGAAGFIGSTYVRLAKEEHEVRVLDKLTYAGRRENLPDDVELVVGAIEDPLVVREAMEGCDAVAAARLQRHVHVRLRIFRVSAVAPVAQGAGGLPRRA